MFKILSELALVNFSELKSIYIIYIVVLLFSSVFEFLSIIILYPFLSLLVSPDSNTRILYYFVLDDLDINTIGLLFFVIMLFLTIFRSGLIMVQAKVSQDYGRIINNKIVAINLKKPLLLFGETAASNFIISISEYTEILVARMLLPLLHAISSLVLLSMILVGMLYVTPVISSIVFSVILVHFSRNIFLIKDKLATISETLEYRKRQKINIVQNIIGSKRDIIINQNESLFYDLFSEAENKVRDSLKRIEIFTQTPKIIIEAVCILTIVFIALLGSNSGARSTMLSDLAIFVFGVQKYFLLGREFL